MFSKLTVHDGKLLTDSGMSYRVLYIPGFVQRMTVPMIRRLTELVAQGAILVGRKPIGGLGLESPDNVVKVLAGKLWGAGDNVVERTVGLGRVYNTNDLSFALRSEDIRPDFDAEQGGLMWLHRRTDDADIYYVTNRWAKDRTVTIRFRVTGRTPEFLTAEDGQSRPLSYQDEGGVTFVTLPLTANEAGFVVFRNPAEKLIRVVPTLHIAESQKITGDWLVHFEPGRGAPVAATFPTLTDWIVNPNPGIKYFSGAATYHHMFNIAPAWIGKGRLILDLGAVRDLAVVYVDGTKIGTVWHAPYRVDLTGKIGAGAHRLDVKVVNLWVNRLIGDMQPGAKPIA